MKKSSVSPTSRTDEPLPCGSGDLEFPHGFDFDPAPRRMKPEAALRLCEEMFAYFKPNALDRETRRDRPSTEFDLANPVSGPENYPADLLDELLQCH